jgi:phage-related protein (TIGR01555 family)
MFGPRLRGETSLASDVANLSGLACLHAHWPVSIGFLNTADSHSEWRLDGALINVLTGLGTAKDRNEAIGVKRSRILSEGAVNALYEQSWLIRRIVEKLPQQGTRSGWDLSVGDETSSSMKSQLDDLVGWTEKLHLRQALAAAATYSRLYGGGAMVLIADDRTPIDKPLNLKRLRTIHGLYPIDRWRLYPAAGWSGIGEPESYWFWTQADRDLQKLNDQAGNKQVTSAGLGITEATQVEIHSSRVIRIEGLPCSWRSQQERQWWGVSVVDLVWDVFKRWETGQQSAADILHDFDLVVHKLPGLANMLAAGGEDKLRQRLQANALARSTIGAYLLNDGEELTNFTRSAAGIADILTSLKSEITGASGMPHTLLWGESPSGLGADGRSEQAAFGNEVADWQAQHLKDPLRRVYELAMACADGPWKGKEPPEDWEITFRPTYTPTDDEQAELRQKVAAADSQYIQAGVLQPNEVALSRFGKPRFSLDTTLLNREEDGSIPQPKQPEEVAFGGTLEGEPGAAAPEQPPAADPALEGPAPTPPRTDADDEPCCDECEARAKELAEQISEHRGRRKRRRDEEPRNDAAGQIHQILGVSVRMDAPGIGRLQAPYGQTLPYPVAVGPDLSGAWEVFEPSTGAYLLALGHQHQRGIRDAIGADATIRRIDGVDMVAMGALCDAYLSGDT